MQKISNTSQLPKNGFMHVMASVTIGLEEFIDQQGGNGLTVLEKAGLGSRLFESPNQFISLERYCNALEGAAFSTGNEHFGLDFGHHITVDALGVLGYHFVTSHNLHVALKNIEKFFPIFQKNSVLQLSVEGNYCILEYKVLNDKLLAHRHDSELTLALINNLIHSSISSQWQPIAVHFNHAMISNSLYHQEIFKCPVFFKKSRNAIVFPKELLCLNLSGNNHVLNTITLNSLQELYKKQDTRESLIDEIKNRIRSLLPNYSSTLESVSDLMNFSPRTLQRHIAEEGSTFKLLVENVRQELALHYLDDEKLSISEIAYLLGYSEVSAFTRAFTRWKKISPANWRKTS